jgi:hypothetical protein
VRSYPRRYRALFAGWSDDEDPDDVSRRRPPGGGWSALQHASRARDVLRAVDAAIRRAVVVDRPTAEVPGAGGAAIDGPAPEATEGLKPVLAELTAAADDLGRALTEVPSDGWDRPAVVDGRERTVLWLAREAVHQGSHHLRDAERVLREVRGRAAG